MTHFTANPTDPQTRLFDQPVNDTGATPHVTPHEHIGFELGWDCAHYRISLPAPYAHESSALRSGLLAGQAAFGARTLAATPNVRKWLLLRLHAWLRGRSVELVQVTPNYLQQIDASHCPITRVALSSATATASGASVDRVRNDAGYAAGNLAMMSTKANHAKAAFGFRDAQCLVQKIEAGQPAGRVGANTAEVRGINGLTAVQWARVAALCSFVEPLTHEEACTLPLHVLPPNRLRLFNPVQAVQAFVSQQLLKPGWSHRIGRIESLLNGKALQRDFNRFFMTLLPRVIEAGIDAGRTEDPVHARWAIEDAWRASLVQQRWTRFARQLTPAQCESLLNRAAARKLLTAVMQPLADASATDGWNLATRGYVPHVAWPASRLDATVPKAGTLFRRQV